MGKSRILRRIKKCLALAESSNEHEAAVALHQAQTLMRKHNLEYSSVLASGVNEVRVSTRYKSRPPGWDLNLVSLISAYFECVSFRTSNPTKWVFVGEGTNPEIATYAYEVLLRQVQRAKETYLAQTYPNELAPVKRRLGRLYCLAWVSKLNETIAQFASETAPPESVRSFLKERGYELEEPKPGKRKREVLSSREWHAWQSGRIAGESAQLLRGVQQDSDGLLLQ